MSSQLRNRIAGWVLGALLVAQFAVLWRSYVYPKLGLTWHYRNEPAFERSLLMGEGSGVEDLRFVEFLRTHVPENATLILPYNRANKFGEPNYMQFFMFPRSIDRCSREWSFDQCYRFMIGEEGYMLRIQDVPEMDEVSARMHYIPWNEDSGLLVPLAEGGS